MKKLGVNFLFIFFMILPFVSANPIVPFSFYLLPFVPLVIILESIIFHYFSNNFFSMKIELKKSILVVGIANIITSLIGTLFYGISEIILLSFIISLILEFLVYIIFLNKNKKIYLFLLSLITNFVSYLILLILFWYIT